MTDYREDIKWAVYIHIVPKAISGYDWDKYYVGITSKNPEKRWNKGYGYRTQLFGRAVKKYGWGNIEHEIVASNTTKEEAKSFEIQLIKMLQSNNMLYGYNLTKGGDYVADSIHNNRMNPIGKKYGRITVTKEVENDKSYPCRLVNGVCDCGTKLYKLNLDSLVSGLSKSCGCYATEIRSKAKKKYNKYDLSGEYGIGYTFKGEEFYFDLEDYDKIKDYCWHIDNRSNKLVTEIGNRRQNTRINLEFSCVIYGFGKQSKKKVKIIYQNNNYYDFRKINMSLCIPDGLSYDEYFYFLTLYNEHVQWDVSHQKWLVITKHLSPQSRYFLTLEEAIEYRNQVYNIEERDGSFFID